MVKLLAFEGSEFRCKVAAYAIAGWFQFQLLSNPRTLILEAVLETCRSQSRLPWKFFPSRYIRSGAMSKWMRCVLPSGATTENTETDES